MIFTLLAALYGAAQEDFVVHEGASTTHFIQENPGSTYLWEVFTGFNPDNPASPDDFSFETPDNQDTVTIRWLREGLFYLKITETDLEGCNNVKARAITVLPNNRTLGFASLSSDDCVDVDNSFTLSLDIQNNSGQPLENSYFPLEVNLRVNSSDYVQQVTAANRELLITDDMFTTVSNGSSTILIEIVSARDTEGVNVHPRQGAENHVRTIYPAPQIAFTEGEIIITQGLSFTHSIQMQVGEPNNAVYNWSVSPAGGTSTNVGAITGNSGSILWDGASGIYTLTVSVNDGNGCTGNPATQTIRVVEPGELIFNPAYPNTFICSNLSTDSDDEGIKETNTFEVEYDGIEDLYSASISIVNPDGIYIDKNGNELDDQQNPSIEILNPEEDKTIQFDVNVSWENTGNSNVAFRVELMGATTVNQREIDAVDGTDIIRLINVRPKPGLDFVPPRNQPVIIELNTTYAFEATYTDGYIYTWWYTDTAGNRNDFTSTTSKTEEILWTNEGEYTLFVQANDSNNCLSEIISKRFIVREGESDLWVNAGSDDTTGWCKPYTLSGTVPDTEGLTFNWQPDLYLDDPTAQQPVFIPGPTTQFTVTVTDTKGNTAKDSVTITVADLTANAGDDVIMEDGATAMLDGSASFGDDIRFEWTTNTGTIDSGENTATPVVSGFGVYYLTVSDKYECTAIDSVVVNRLTFAPIANDDYDTTNFAKTVRIPILDNDYDPDGDIDSMTLSITMSPANGVAFVNYNDFTISYTPNDGFTGSDIFEYQICDIQQQCDEANVYVQVNNFVFLIPQAFTPNGDGINDYFEILGIEFYEGNSISIMNRWGHKVYEANNYGIDTNPIFWDGKSNRGGDNSDLPSGTYFYVLDLGNGQQPIAGSVYIDR